MACDTYSLIKFFVFQLLYLSQRHIEYMLMAWIYLAFQDSIFKLLKVGPVNPTYSVRLAHRGIWTDECFVLRTCADWSYIDMRYTYPPYVLWNMSLTHKCRLAHPRISGTCADLSYIEIFLPHAMNISTIRNMWCIYRHQTYFETCDTNIYTPCAQVSPTWGGPRDMPLTTRGATNTPTNTQY